MINRCERNSAKCYSVCCCCHKCCLRWLSKYSHSETILQSLAFQPASKEMYALRQKTKSILPDLYMMGNFYITLAKVLIVCFGILISYILLVQDKPDIFSNLWNLFGPLAVILLLFRLF